MSPFYSIKAFYSYIYSYISRKYSYISRKNFICCYLSDEFFLTLLANLLCFGHRYSRCCLRLTDVFTSNKKLDNGKKVMS